MAKTIQNRNWAMDELAEEYAERILKGVMQRTRFNPQTVLELAAVVRQLDVAARKEHAIWDKREEKKKTWDLASLKARKAEA